MRVWALVVGLALVPTPAIPPGRAAAQPAKALAAAEHYEHRLAPVHEQVVSAALPSEDAWRVINWVIASHDNNGMPFIVVDKVAAELFVFDSTGQMIAVAPALIGMTVGDAATPGIGDRELSNIPPMDRKTPAGRFVAKFGRAAGARDVLWVDYPSAISIHAVMRIKNQHRLERLNSPTAQDNRITYGCINVPTKFYSEVIKPLFKGTSGIVYVLPETAPPGAVFLAMPPPSRGSAE